MTNPAPLNHTYLKGINYTSSQGPGYACVGKSVNGEHQRFLGALEGSFAKGDIHMHTDDPLGSYRIYTPKTGWGSLQDKNWEISVIWDSDKENPQKLGRFGGREFYIVILANGQVTAKGV